MILEYEKKSKSAGAVFLVAYTGAIVCNALVDPKLLAIESVALQLVAPILIFIGSMAFFYSCWLHIKARGRSGWWILMLLLSILGLIVLALLKDHAADVNNEVTHTPLIVSMVDLNEPTKHRPQVRVRMLRIGIVFSIVWLIVSLIISVAIGDNGRRYDTSAFIIAFLIIGLLPLVVAWGIVWVRAADEEQKNTTGIS